MPRKRQIKKVRCVPEIPQGDEGKDLTKNEQQQKLQVFLADFDRKFEEKKQKMHHKIELTLKRIDTYCHMGIQQIPTSLRKMKLVDFIAAGGTFESASEYLDKKDDPFTNKSIDSLKAIGQGDVPSGSQLYSDPTFQKIAGDCASAIEQLENQNPTTGKRFPQTQANSFCPSAVKEPLAQIQEIILDDGVDGIVTRTLRSTRHRNVVNSSMKPPLSTARKVSRLRTGSRIMQTPLGSQMLSKNLMTPAITPKFDPRLPPTPFDRNPRPGERLMSIAGSPVVIQPRRNKNTEKIQERIGSALMSETLDYSGAMTLLNEVMDMFKE